MNKILTIVIPTYNMEKYLHRCLSSLVIDEKLMDILEVLVVNDGSKDNSSSIAHEYQDKYPATFRVIDKENGNYGSCVNRGLKEAQGKYIKILDADDWFVTENLPKYIDFLSTHDADLILNDARVVDAEGCETGRFSCEAIRENLTLPFKKIADLGYFPQMHCVAYKTDLLREHGYVQTEGISYTDQEWTSMPMAYVRTFSYCRTDLYLYLLGREGQTMDVQVMNKTFSNLSKVAFSILAFTTSMEDVEEVNRRYLERKRFSFIITLYENHILKGYYADDAFRGFDSQFEQQYPEAYRPFISKWFIRSWRSRNISLPFACLWEKVKEPLRKYKNLISTRS